MDYGALIREAWQTTWRHRFLWIPGLFAGGAVGVSSGGSANGNGAGAARPAPVADAVTVPPDAGQFAQRALVWVGENADVLVGLVTLAVLLGLTLLVVSLYAQAGMAEATVDLASGRSSSLGRAWRAARRLFWRYAGLALLLLGAAAVLAAVLGAAAAAVLAPLAAGAQLLGIGAVAVGVPLVLVAIVAAVALSIVGAYAQRAIYAEDLGPAAAVRRGWRLLRAAPGTSALVWLVNLALALGAGLASGLAFVALVAVLVGLGAGVWAVAGGAALRVSYVALAALVVAVAGVLVTAVSNTFFWNYWTLAYLRLADGGRESAPV